MIEADIKKAAEYLDIALGGNMNFGTLKPRAIAELMQGFHEQQNQHCIDERNRIVAKKNLDINRCNHKIYKAILFIEEHQENPDSAIDRLKIALLTLRGMS